MTRASLRAAAQTSTTFVFFFVVISGLVMGYARADPKLSRTELVYIILLSVVYLFTGTVIFISVLTSGSPRNKIIYLVFQITLGLLILYLERGNGWLILLPIASHSVALFSPREAILPCILITLGIAWNTSTLIPTWIPFVQSTLVFGSAVFFAAVFTDISIRDTRRREQIEHMAADLEKANSDLKAYAGKVEELAAAQERNRLAREIHDGLGHYLTALNLEAKVASALVNQDPGRAQESLSKIQAMVLEALADVRRSVAALRSEPLPWISLLEALESLVSESRASGIPTYLTVEGVTHPLPAAHELTIYRAVQEALTNARKYAQAKKINIVLKYCHQQVLLHIQDDGIGCILNIDDLKNLKNNFGLFGLRERVLLLGGSMNLQTAPGQGFCLEIGLPDTQVQ